MMPICPACQKTTFEPSGFKVNIEDVLSRWEKHMGTGFDPEVWAHYRSATDESMVQSRCSFCGFGLFDPMLEGTNEFYESITASEYYVSDKWEHTQAIKDLRCQRVKRVFDIGCGSGLFLKLMRKQEPSIYLMGQEKCATFFDAKLFNVEMFIGGIDEIIRKTSGMDKFDAITMFQVLEHVSDPWKLLETCYAILRPGGTLIVSTPDGGGPITHFKDSLTEIPPHHLTQWTETSYRFCLPRFGFDVVRIRREPLPNYLWNSYLPVLWDSNIWPSQFLNEPSTGTKENLDIAVQYLRDAGITHLHGVPGHTIYIVARKNNAR